jgi:anti-anti-sigma regulatory factor
LIVEFYEDIVQISGSLKSNFWDTIHTAISLALKKHPNGVIVDCSGITECTIEGADTFRDAMEYIKRQDARIILAAVPKEVLEIFKSVPEVRSQLAIASSVEEARHSMDLPTHELGKQSSGVQTGMQIACLLSGAACDKVALQVASTMVRAASGHLHVVFPIIVPRDLPLQAPLSQQEDLASATVMSAKAFLKEQHVNCSVHIERGRDSASIMAFECEESNATCAIIPLPCSLDEREAAAQTTRNMLAKLKCMVLFARDKIG